MKTSTKKFISVFLLCSVLLSAGCTSSDNGSASSGTQATKANVFPDELYTQEIIIDESLAEPMVPLSGTPLAAVFQNAAASGTVVYTGSKNAVVDASNTADGYVMIKCDGTAARLKVIITGPSGVQYTYNLNNQGNYETFVLSDGSGKYNVGVYENVVDTKYAILINQDINVTLKNEFAPFLYSNQYVNFNAGSQVVQLAATLTAGAANDVDKIAKIYDYVINNISYDTAKAQTVQSGYLPDVDTILNTKKGICFDYAAVMASMLRSQGIPAKLVVGYTGSAYHAWITTYTNETGWINGVIFFDGTTWKLMDPTFASGANSSEAIMQYIGDGQNYQEKYLY